jgi:putative oxidoreductase
MLNSAAPFLSLTGRVLLALIFILSGPGKILSAQATAAFMASGGLPNSPALAVLVGVFELVAGLALAFGVRSRWAALSLAVFTLVASLMYHAYWAAPADQQFVQQLLFTKNIGLVGALLFVAGFGAGAWSWESRGALPIRTFEGRQGT